MLEGARGLARRSYPLTKWHLTLRMKRQRGVPIVVFCMPKTASTSVARAVRAAVPNPVFRIHILTPERVARAEANYRQTDRSARPLHLWESQHLSRRLPTPDHPWWVITVVRDPVAQAVSEFFQSAERFGVLGDPASTRAALESFLSRRIPVIGRWFDDEFAPNIGVDVYGQPFPCEAGSATLETASARVLLLRQEDLATAAPGALAAFLRQPRPVPIPRENVGSTKEYASLYDELAREVRLPESLLDAAYSSRLVAHFYAPREIDEFRRRWSLLDAVDAVDAVDDAAGSAGSGS